MYSFTIMTDSTLIISFGYKLYSVVKNETVAKLRFKSTVL